MLQLAYKSERMMCLQCYNSYALQLYSMSQKPEEQFYMFQPAHNPDRMCHQCYDSYTTWVCMICAPLCIVTQYGGRKEKTVPFGVI